MLRKPPTKLINAWAAGAIPFAAREPGSGRPTKAERRAIAEAEAADLAADQAAAAANSSEADA